MPAMLPDTLDRVFRAALHHGASDVHLRPDEPARLRVGDQLLAARAATVREEEILALIPFARQVPDGDAWNHLDFSFACEDLGRLRVHLFRQRGRRCAVVRLVPDRIPTLQELRLPAALKRLPDHPQGLVLVTGATGMGKSTTIASLLQLTAEERPIHVVTIEDPIEFEIHSERSAITQREIGFDVGDYLEGIRAAMREDPDVIMLGEIRDVETMRATLLAAESGHLVVSTIHTKDAPTTLGKLIGFFPPEEQAVARIRLAECLVATVSQMLLPLKGSTKRVVATELMYATASVRERVRDAAKGPAIVEAMERGRGENGMHTFDESALALVKAGLVDAEVAARAVRSPGELMRALRAEGLR